LRFWKSYTPEKVPSIPFWMRVAEKGGKKYSSTLRPLREKKHPVHVPGGRRERAEMTLNGEEKG